jgi:hypothetical protein
MANKKEIVKKETTADLKKKDIVLKSEKETLAKQRANELLSGLSLPDSVKKSLNLESKKDDILIIEDDKPPLNALEESKKSKSDEWLQDELAKVTDDLENVRKELTKSKEEYTKLFNSFKTGSVNTQVNSIDDQSSIYKQKLRVIFNEFEANFLGTNPQRQKFSDVKIQHILNKLVENFPFLMEGR